MDRWKRWLWRALDALDYAIALMARLECPICAHSWEPPIFRCATGHFACIACQDPFSNKDRCYKCNHRYRRSFLLEDVIRSPCRCSEPGCAFVGSPAWFIYHLRATHSWPVNLIDYGKACQLQLPASKPQCLLVAKGDMRVFVLSVSALRGVSLECLRANAVAGPHYTCKIWATGSAAVAAGKVPTGWVEVEVPSSVAAGEAEATEAEDEAEATEAEDETKATEAEDETEATEAEEEAALLPRKMMHGPSKELQMHGPSKELQLIVRIDALDYTVLPMYDGWEQDTVNIDNAKLQCPICTHPLKPPMFQCAAGHFACGACHGQFPNKDRCYKCAHPGGYSRSFLLEDVIRWASVDIPQARRPHAPCRCSDLGCAFTGEPAWFIYHLRAMHSWTVNVVDYGKACQVQLPASKPRCVLVAKEDMRVFVLSVAALCGSISQTVLCGGVSLVCLRPNAAAGPHYTCKMSVTTRSPAAATGKVLAASVEMEVPSSAVAGEAEDDEAAQVVNLDGPSMELRLNVRIDRAYMNATNHASCW